MNVLRKFIMAMDVFLRHKTEFSSRLKTLQAVWYYLRSGWPKIQPELYKKLGKAGTKMSMRFDDNTLNSWTETPKGLKAQKQNQTEKNFLKRYSFT